MNSAKKFNQVKINQEDDITDILQELYLNEYNEFYQNIFNYPRETFLTNVFERVLITAKKKFNGIIPPELTKQNFERFILDIAYFRDIKIAKFIIRNLKYKLDKKSKISFFNGQIIEHCQNCSSKVIHSCGEQFYPFLYERSNSISRETEYDSYLVCMKCTQIYKEDFIKCFCESCNADFYTKILEDSSDQKELPFATWKNYHCNVIMNDIMRCVECGKYLFYDKKCGKLFCSYCDKRFNPEDILWSCLICQKKFTSEAKEYNPYEYKNMKMCVKDSLINKIKAKPERMYCGCSFNISKTDFYHNKNCNGELYEGEMNKRKILVCSKCEALNFSEHFVWTCPMCGKKVKNGGFESSNKKQGFMRYESCQKLKSSNYFKNKVKEVKNEEPEKEPEKEEPKVLFKRKENQKVLSSAKKMKRIMIPTPVKNCNSNNKLNFNEVKSPLSVIKQDLMKKFSEESIRQGVKNLSSIFNNCRKDSSRELIKKNDSKFLINKVFINDSMKSNNAKDEKMALKLDSKKSDSGLDYDSTSVSNQDENSFKNASANQPKKPVKETPKKVNETQKHVARQNEEDLFKLDISKYTIIKQIGEGSYGRIFKVEDSKGNLYALKKLLGASECDMNSLENEFKILSQLVKIDSNLNLVKIYGLERKVLDPTTTVLYVLMDLADRDWESEINQRSYKKKRYSENELINICKQIIPTFAFLQKKGITHRDVKPQNILVFAKNNEYKLADFGEAKNNLRNFNVTQKQTLRGTELYLSPILFQRLKKYPDAIYAKHNTYKSDVFSFGLCILFAANLGFNIVNEIREKESDAVIRRIITDKLKNYYSTKFLDFLLKTLLIEEKDRFDFVELEDYFMKQFN